jgi:rare lipoprotein A (peptidoglycan hydrolase)
MQLTDRAARALEAQEAARRLLVQAVQAVAEQQARDAADAQRAETARAQAQAASLTASLAASRTELDVASAVVTQALTPAQTRRSLNAAVREAPVVALVESAGAGYPPGYRPTGQVQRGVASWYGPGFVGKPTASGAPYDPERLTCAHKALKLGTVVRVTRGSLAITCLVNDRGPFVGDRIIDLSRAGSRALGFDGVAEVAVEVLAPST